MKPPETFGERLYRIVPEIYRRRDENGDLRRYLEAAGALLDRVYASLEQRHADNFPDTPFEGPACQDWLVPYFAELFQARLVSPLPAARRDEVAHAIGWRQGKGTRHVIESVAEAVGRLEVVLQEGFQRVAITPRPGMHLVPATAYGYPREAPESFPRLAAEHPQLPAATLDFRCHSGAVSSQPGAPGAQHGSIDSRSVVWRQASHHAVPCHPGAFDDVSRRTLDFRTPSYRQGHHHPRRVLLYVAPPPGFFPAGAPRVSFGAPLPAAFTELVEVSTQGNVTRYHNKSLGTPGYVPVGIDNDVELGDGSGDPEQGAWELSGLVFHRRLSVSSGRLQLRECAVRELELSGADAEVPRLRARDCLLGSVTAPLARLSLEYCTLLGACRTPRLLASDCIFLGRIERAAGDPAALDPSCLRYSRYVPDQPAAGLRVVRSTSRPVVLFEAEFGERSAGVLHPATHRAVRHGAEDGREMGAYHHAASGTAGEIITDKLSDFLPVGMEAVVIYDPALLQLGAAVSDGA